MRIELAECSAIPLAFVEHDRPTESGLRRFQYKELKMRRVIVNWHSPFAIVILDHERVVRTGPGTSFDSHIIASTQQIPGEGSRPSRPGSDSQNVRASLADQ